MKYLFLLFIFSSAFAENMQSTDMDVLQAYQAGLIQGTIECNEKWLVKFNNLKYRYQYWDSVKKVEPRIRKLWNQNFDKRKVSAK